MRFTSWGLAYSWASCAQKSTPSRRSYGLHRFGWSLWPSCRSWSCCSRCGRSSSVCYLCSVQG
ncbi:unnamed protein product [Symbiodinium microadriaticum]|nr:unnamed protein product [Symbiodinium microadriaticum]CAE7880391.1 unnamed protein product [Symbiodinium sp. KB8]